MVQEIITIAALVSAVVLIVSYCAKVLQWVHHQTEQDERMTAIEAEIRESKAERALMVRALRACLEGLSQLGANHTVPTAKAELDRYLNEQAHR